MVMRKLSGPSPALQMEAETIKGVTEGWFPARDTDVGELIAVTNPPPPFTVEELDAGVRRFQSRRKAPGPDGINCALLTAAHRARPEWLLRIFNCCVSTGVYPSRGKRAILVLLKKDGKPAVQPSSYRPLCLLDDVGKLLEFLLVQRIGAHIEANGGLSPSQYGFRRGMSTMGAAIALRDEAKAAVNRYDMSVAWIRQLGYQECV